MSIQEQNARIAAIELLLMGMQNIDKWVEEKVNYFENNGVTLNDCDKILMHCAFVSCINKLSYLIDDARFIKASENFDDKKPVSAKLKDSLFSR